MKHFKSSWLSFYFSCMIKFIRNPSVIPASGAAGTLFSCRAL